MGMLYCTNCQETFDKTYIKPVTIEGQENYVCPHKWCNGDLVEIDELILPAIKMFNAKGYTTEYCCSGHMEEEYSTPYIKFANHVEKGDIITLQKLYLEKLPSAKNQGEDMIDYANEIGLGWEAIMYQEQLTKLGLLDSVVKPFNWEHELDYTTSFEMARRMAVDLKFYNEIPCFSDLDSPNPEENWWYPQRNSEKERERIKKLYQLFKKNCDEIKQITMLDEFPGLVHYDKEKDTFFGYHFNDMVFLLDVYGPFAWDGEIILRGKEIHKAADEKIRDIYEEDTAEDFIKGKNSLYKHEYDGVVFGVWTQELTSITEIASILDDFVDSLEEEDDDENIDPEKCEVCEMKADRDAYKNHVEPFKDFLDVQDDENEDEYENDEDDISFS